MARGQSKSHVYCNIDLTITSVCQGEVTIAQRLIDRLLELLVKNFSSSAREELAKKSMQMLRGILPENTRKYNHEPAAYELRRIEVSVEVSPHHMTSPFLIVYIVRLFSNCCKML